jgi:hypothetical protein
MGGQTSIPGQNILDPLGAAIERRTFGAGREAGKRKKKGGGGGKFDPFMAMMSQMQADQAAQAERNRIAQRDALIEQQRQSALASAKQGELGAQQMLSQAGAMQQAKDIAAQQAQQQAASAAGTAAIGGAYDIGKAQQEQAANLAGVGAIPTGAALPFYGMNEVAATTPASRSANLFNLPKTTDIKFGGV